MSRQQYIVYSSAFYTLADAVRWADRQKVQIAHTGSKAFVMKFDSRYYVVRSITDRDRTEQRLTLTYGGNRIVTFLEYAASLESHHPQGIKQPKYITTVSGEMHPL